MINQQEYEAFTQGAYFVSETQINWWNSLFGLNGMRPSGLCNYLAKGLPGQRENIVARIDQPSRILTAEVSGHDADGEVFRIERSLEIGIQIYLGFAHIRDDHQRRGYGSAMVRNCLRLARSMSMERLQVHAVAAGTYSWARIGYLPTRECWNDAAFKQALQNRLDAFASQLTDEEVAAIETYISSTNPQTIWRIADQDKIVLYRDGATHLTLGEAMLAFLNPGWEGTIEIKTYQLDNQIKRVRNYLKLRPEEF